MNNKGFTLLEVLVALSIMAGTVVTVLAVVNHHLSVATEASEAAVSTLLARQQLTALLHAQEKSGSGSFTPSFPEYTWTSTVSPVSDLPLSQLVVTVRNTRGGKDVSLVTYFQ